MSKILNNLKCLKLMSNAIAHQHRSLIADLLSTSATDICTLPTIVSLGSQRRSAGNHIRFRKESQRIPLQSACILHPFCIDAKSHHKTVMAAGERRECFTTLPPLPCSHHWLTKETQ
ncbi:hypothetical protein AB205_0011210 [Aquarana catesbeiana]|uniref:Uncharacterized protein n=1 Tax=Aquarana catesbeiana TaxID=8400 RepID=A0A2G9SG55_AQUCT|nr:hypothetical protein AB205_0011210 [Aquarana catesbeiana]